MRFSLALVQGAGMDQALDVAGKGFGTGVVTGGIATFGAHYVSAKQNGVKPLAGKATAKEEIITVQFGKTENQKYHTFRHTDDLGLSRGLVQTSVEMHLKTVSSQLLIGKPFNQIIPF